ncbi:tyrosine-type recombinase/integrase [Desulforhopalus singaporensis]|nr:site-specific integrase [Desulforhopalus singaporensis]
MRDQSSDGWQEPINTVSLGDWSLQYLDYARDKFVDKTYKEKRKSFKELFKVVDPTMPVEEMTTALAMQNSQVQYKNRSGYAANKDRKNLLAAWGWGTKYMSPVLLPKENPFAIEKMPEERSPRYVPSLEDFWKVCDIAQGQDKVMLKACILLAARRGELFRLKLADLDFDNNQVRLWTRKRVGGTWEYDWLPMVTELKDAFKWWLDNREVSSEFVFVCVDQTDFTREYYGEPFTSRQHLLARLCEKAEVKKFGFHGIRHLAATELYRRGCSVAVIQRILRHTSPNTTEKLSIPDDSGRRFHSIPATHSI